MQSRACIMDAFAEYINNQLQDADWFDGTVSRLLLDHMCVWAQEFQWQRGLRMRVLTDCDTGHVYVQPLGVA